LTLCELWLELAAGRKRQRLAYERDVGLAWATEFMARQKELGPKSLDLLLKPRRGRQTKQEVYQVMQQIAAAYGLTLEYRPTVPA
jgi:hypothetical protein